MAGPLPYSEYKGKVVLLTGIGQSDKDSWGNGAATALFMARHGAIIFGCDLTIEPAEYNKKRIEQDTGATVDVMTANVTEEGSVKALVDACMAKHGRIDILVNNVGRSEPGGPAEITPNVWDAQMAVNMKSVFLCCHFVLPIMEAQGGGVVINVASIAALRYIGKPQVGYSASKAAVISFTSATAVLYAPKNIRMNVIVPGLMATPLLKLLADKYANGDYEGFSAKRNAQVPMQKMGDAFDVANAALFLASDMARYITGQQLVVDGGITRSTGRV